MGILRCVASINFHTLVSWVVLAIACGYREVQKHSSSQAEEGLGASQHPRSRSAGRQPGLPRCAYPGLAPDSCADSKPVTSQGTDTEDLSSQAGSLMLNLPTFAVRKLGPENRRDLPKMTQQAGVGGVQKTLPHLAPPQGSISPCSQGSELKWGHEFAHHLHLQGSRAKSRSCQGCLGTVC